MKMLIPLFSFVVAAFSGILALVLGASCSPFSSSSASQMVAYYMARIDVAVSGRVIDRDTLHGIAGIRVSLLRGATTNTSITGTDGSFGLYVNGVTNGIMELRADDIDGANNGSYSNKSTQLPITNTPYSASIDLILEPLSVASGSSSSQGSSSSIYAVSSAYIAPVSSVASSQTSSTGLGSNTMFYMAPVSSAATDSSQESSSSETTAYYMAPVSSASAILPGSMRSVPSAEEIALLRRELLGEGSSRS